ncbi:MAG: polyhydroxybutyrate depolymerase [Streptosporangiaceae bacterium]|jgi:polyhydroxybutyrate depolymerase|nr:Polyhydroxybutyrate depolymerase [Streptosporangiaceae bacterium]MDX6429437.1 polyhydroxybutyrate depolymerase [Streptosporangiaceae bacterium]
MRRALFLLAAIVLVLAGAIAGCKNQSGQGGQGGESAAPGRSGQKGGGRRPTTVQGIPTGTGTFKLNLDVGTVGHREYLLHVPAQLTKGSWRSGKPVKPLPLVLAMHGGLSNMQGMRELTGFDGLSDQKGFLVAYPDGFMTTWNAGDCCGAAKIGNVDDVGFLTKLIDKLVGSGLADGRRVYATGFSNGAGMAYRLACDGPGKVAAIGVVEGALVMSCHPGRPVSALIFHGTADRSVPYNGGGNRDFNDHRPFPPVSQAVDFWRKADKLPGLRQTSLSRELSRASAQCTSTGKGGDGAEVSFCRIDGGTHHWPSTASTQLWDFFAAHPRPS